MFLFIPIIGIIVLIFFAISFKGNPLPPYNNVPLACIIVFLVGPFLVSFLSYSLQYLISKNKNSGQLLVRFSSFPAYVVFFCLVLPQLIPGSNGSWLHTALGKFTSHFTWTNELLQSGSTFRNVSVMLLQQILLVSQYFFVFSFYMIISERFKTFGAKKFYTHLPVSFLTNNRMLIFGYFYVFLVLSLDYLIKYFNVIALSATSFGNSENTMLFIQVISIVSSFAFPLLFLMFFPLILPKIAGWKPLTDGPALDMIQHISRENNFTYHKVYLAGQPGLLTAGIIGVFPWTRNLMFTKDIMELLDEKEQESVLLHEIGHAKYYHIFTYLLFFMGFSVVMEVISVGLSAVSVNKEIALMIYFGAFVAFVYYGWGWLSRLCERQADLNAAEVQGTPAYIISSFEKLSDSYGDIMDKPSWHHGSLGVRIQNLKKAYDDSGESRKSFHQLLKRIKLLILSFFLCMAVVFPFVNGGGSDKNDDTQIVMKSHLAMNYFEVADYKKCIETYQNLLEFLKESDVDAVIKNETKTLAYYNMACAFSKMNDANSAYNSLNNVLSFLTPNLMNIGLSEHKFATDSDFDFIRESEWFQNYLRKVKTVKEAFDHKKANPFLKSIKD